MDFSIISDEPDVSLPPFPDFVTDDSSPDPLGYGTDFSAAANITSFPTVLEFTCSP
jgi:hypothetical protein